LLFVAIPFAQEIEEADQSQNHSRPYKAHQKLSHFKALSILHHTGYVADNEVGKEQDQQRFDIPDHRIEIYHQSRNDADDGRFNVFPHSLK
jgi:hypothetical protein